MKKVFIYKNDLKASRTIADELRNKLISRGVSVSESLTGDVDLIINVGGDGTFLSLMQNFEFPTAKVAGINTGHLGFFQEIAPEETDRLIDAYLKDELCSQKYNIVKAEIRRKNGETIAHRALNEFVVKGKGTKPIHLDIGINGSFIEKFSGDGIIVSTPAGSTGYNYSLGGSIVDPRLNLLQVVPMAPMNTTAYRSLTSSFLIPAEDQVIIRPADSRNRDLYTLYDGRELRLRDIESISFRLSNRKINLVRFGDTSFWDKVKNKFL
ncbi:MAG: NAD(+)/NADH kinase [Firmicutes bacterium]|nr:NAD(+)/NADH kinase [Bacillota bacterium]MBQ2305264.1 NAD(+)/NADH kinase [Bacillota bacterium]